MNMNLVSFLVVVQGLFSTVNGIRRFGRKKDANFGVSKGKVLKGHVISSHIVDSPIDCSTLCISEPQCLSHNYKPKGAGNQDLCELNNATRNGGAVSYVDDPKYHHYYDRDTEESRSCLDYLRNGAKENGIYTITDASGDTYPVYCDLTSEPRSAWTLMLSFKLKNALKNAFLKSFEVDIPLESKNPNWEEYRMSLKQMTLLKSQSTHFRVTTSFMEYGVDYVDYLRILLIHFDVLKRIAPGSCHPVEYINIRGHKGVNVEVAFWSDQTFMFHTDSHEILCEFKSVKQGAVWSENNFGCYVGAQRNPKFRGTMNDESTTEMWMGGYL